MEFVTPVVDRHKAYEMRKELDQEKNKLHKLYNLYTRNAPMHGRIEAAEESLREDILLILERIKDLKDKMEEGK